VRREFFLRQKVRSQLKTKLIIIEGKQIGIVGLDEVFEELYQAGIRPEKGLKVHLLERLKPHNYIPLAKDEIYASVFLDEYQRFCDSKEGKIKEKRKNLKSWRGVPREEIPWFPSILDDLCDGCMICLKFCPYGVFEYDDKTNKIGVKNPFNCVVGCNMCAQKCKPKAILFPPLTILETFRKR